MNWSKTKHLASLLLALDLALTGLAFVLALDIAYQANRFGSDSFYAHLVLLPCVLLLNGYSFYRQKVGLFATLRWWSTIYMLRIFLVPLGGLMTVIFLFDLDFVSRLVVGLYAVFLVVSVVGSRLFLSWWYFYRRKEHPENYNKVLLIGSGPRAARALEILRNHSDWGMEVVGALDPNPERVGTVFDGIKVIGTLDSVEDILSNSVVDEVVVALPRSLLNDIGPIAEACEEQAVCMRYFADLYDMNIANVHLDIIDDLPVLNFEPVSQDMGKLMIKRIFDLAVTMAALPILLPVFLIVAIAIKLDSKGPVFFFQDRVGLHKRRFKMMKFRSMHTDAEERLKDIEHLNEAEGPIFKMTNDPRVTRVGNFIRRTSIDELPQFLNVLLGHMSIIGPRPMSARDVELFDKGVQRRRFSVRPGLACLREVSGRSALSFERWLELDLQYIEEWSLWLDLRILMRLVPAVLRGSGAV